jgi:uncharacterized protein involved in response to NO
MSLLHISLPGVERKEPPPTGLPIFRLGFRFFFFAAALWSVLMLLVWVPIYRGEIRLVNHFWTWQWHAREMLFGFTGAVIVGFLLTAAGNWTQRPMPEGRLLAGLAGLWTLGRLLPFFTFLPVWLVAAVDVIFFPLVGVILARPILEVNQPRNLPFPLLLGALGAANLLSWMGLRNPQGVAVGTEMALYICLGVIVYMGGRVIPGFTHGRIPKGRTTGNPRLETVCLWSFGLAAAGDVLGLPPGVMMFVFAVATVAHFLRMEGWYTPEIRREPLIWILHAAYAWLVFGLFLKTGVTLAVVNPMLARHAFTAGTIGTVCLGMMCRVTLGHTGRSVLELRPGTVIAFGLLQLAAVFRVLLPMLVPAAYFTGIRLSALCWVAAFGIYLIQYGPFLFKTRADGKAG